MANVYGRRKGTTEYYGPLPESKDRFDAMLVLARFAACHSELMGGDELGWCLLKSLLMVPIFQLHLLIAL